MSVCFVTAIYRVYESEDAPPGSLPQELLGRLRTLAFDVKLLVFCEFELYEAVHNELGELASVVIMDISQTQVSQALAGVTKLPPHRNPAKDTKAYMTLMCNKSEFLRKARELSPCSQLFVWIDGGITKILTEDASNVLTSMVERVHAGGCATRILMPGCWPKGASSYFQAINWRFCGGFAIVPNQLVDTFADAVVRGCEKLARETDCAVWEVNVWAMIEDELPITWYKGDHDASIFDFPRLFQ